MPRAQSRILVLLLVSILLGCASESPGELLAMADQALAEGDSRTALIHLRNVLETDPENVEAITRIGRLYSLSGDARSAERFFRSAVRLGADPADFRLDWLRAQLSTGRFEELLDDTDPLPTDVPAASVLSIRGYALQALGRLSDAEREFRSAIDADPDSASGYTDLAQLLLILGQTEQADEQIAASLQRDQDFATALVLLGTRQFAEGNSSSAATTMTRALQIAEETGDTAAWMSAISGLAEINLFEGNIDEARAAINRAADRMGDSVGVRYLQAQLAAQQGELDDARTILQGILGDLGEHAPSQRLLGSIYLLEGSLDLAELYLKMAINSDARDAVARGLLAAVRIQQDKPGEALELLGDQSQLMTDGQSGFLALAGQANLQAGNIDRALEIFGAGAEQFPNDWRFVLGQALAYLRVLRTDEAILLLETLDERDAPEVRGTTMVLSLVQKGDLEKADSEARRLAEKYPDAPWAQNLLAAWLMQQRRFAEASQFYARSYALQPAPEAAAGAAEARVRGGIPEPTEFLEDWLARNPDDLPTRHALAQISLANADYVRGRDLYETIIADDKQHVGALNNLAWIYIQLDDPRAVEVGQRAFRLAGRNPAVADTYGWAEVRFGSAERGLEALQQAVATQPGDPAFQFHLAVALARTGSTDMARQRLTALVESGEQFAEMSAAREALAAL